MRYLKLNSSQALRGLVYLLKRCGGLLGQEDPREEKQAAGLCAVWESEAKGELLISVGCWVLERRQDLFSSDCRPRPSQKGCLYTAHHITHAQTHMHALAAKIRGDIFIFCNDTPLTRCVIVHALVYTAGRTWSLTWKECPRLSANEEWLHVNGLPWQLTMDTLA